MADLRHGERDSVVDVALDAMDAEQLRALIRALIPWLVHVTRVGLVDAPRSGDERLDLVDTPLPSGPP